MIKQTYRLRSYAAILLTLLLVSCGGANTPQSAFDLTPFKERAQAAGCDDIRNRLFLIDNQLVFWEVAGDCPDASYGQTLYGRSLEQILCIAHDSIAGPVKECPDSQYQAMFDTITANLDQPDLGLGADHTVEPVPF
jgi:hypothetical protein